MAEWFNAAVLKTAVGVEPTGSSNPPLSALALIAPAIRAFSTTDELSVSQIEIKNGLCYPFVNCVVLSPMQGLIRLSLSIPPLSIVMGGISSSDYGGVG